MTPELKKRIEKIRENDKIYFDRRVKRLQPLTVHQHVAIRSRVDSDWSMRGEIVEVLPFRQYKIKSATGSVLVRNRKHLRPIVVQKVNHDAPLFHDYALHDILFPRGDGHTLQQQPRQQQEHTQQRPPHPSSPIQQPPLQPKGPAVSSPQLVVQQQEDIYSDDDEFIFDSPINSPMTTPVRIPAAAAAAAASAASTSSERPRTVANDRPRREIKQPTYFDAYKFW